MASIETTRPAVAKNLRTLADALNLRNRTAGGGRRLGDELIDTTVGAIVGRSVDRQEDPQGRRWRPLRPRTVARKRRLGLDPRINIETHEMLDPGQVRGRTAVTADVAQTVAGLDEETRAKVGFAEEGGPNRPKRPFEDLGPDGVAAVEALLGEAVDAAVTRAGG